MKERERFRRGFTVILLPSSLCGLKGREMEEEEGPPGPPWGQSQTKRQIWTLLIKQHSHISCILSLISGSCYLSAGSAVRDHRHSGQQLRYQGWDGTSAPQILWGA